MKSITIDYILLRGLLPLCLLESIITRYNGFSFVYLIMSLICPLLRYDITVGRKKSVMIYLIILVFFSGLFSLIIATTNILSIFHLLSLQNCSNSMTNIAHQIGVSKLKGILYYRVFRYLFPDYLILIISTSLLIYFNNRKYIKEDKTTENIDDDNYNNNKKSTIKSDQLNINSYENINNLKEDQSLIGNPSKSNTSKDQEHSYLHKTLGIDQLKNDKWRKWATDNLFVFFNLGFTGITGIISPSVLNSLYLFVFLCIGTLWASGKTVFTKKFNYMCVFLIFYSGIHVCLLYLMQIECAQYYVPNGQFLSRLLGLYYLINTSCDGNGSFKFNSQRLVDYFSPFMVMYVYYLWATETRRWFEEYQETKPIIKNIEEVDQVEFPNEIEMRSDNLKSSADITFSNSRNKDSLEMSSKQVTSHTEKPLILSIIESAIHNSFVFTFIAMMGWSATYKSWMSFVLLLLACYLWMIPNSRNACLYTSPVIVGYATTLIIIQYVYGFNLPELPTQATTSGGSLINLSEIGLHKWDVPTGPLIIMIGFLVVFWLTLRLFMTEKSLHVSNKQTVKQENHKISEEFFGNVDNPIYQNFILFLNGICVKYWIVVCCFSMLLVSIQGSVAGFRIIYMVMLLYFIITFMCSYTFWRRQMYIFWWIVIIYSVIVLLAIYVIQFEQIPYLWKNKTGIPEMIMRNIGLRRYKPSALFQGLLTPVLFLVVLIVQLKYFHRPFLKLYSLKRFRSTGEYVDKTDRMSENNCNIANDTNSIVSEFINDVNIAYQTLVEKLKLIMEIIDTYVWRFGECHFTKLFALVVVYVCVKDVNACNVLLLIFVVLGFPFPKMHAILVKATFFYCSMLVLMKMIYQLDVIHSLNWLTNCSLSMKNQTDNAKWIGLEKVHNFQTYIWPLVTILIICTIWCVIQYHQNHLYDINECIRTPRGIIFPEIEIHSSDDSFTNFIKIIFNFTFYKLGLELGFVVTVIVCCLRVDLYSLVYLFFLMAFLFTNRRMCSKIWLPYLLLLALLLPIQYIICVGMPPGLCQNYPFKEVNINLQRWLYLPSYENPPVPEKIMADFFQFFFVSLQYQVFQLEKSNTNKCYNYGQSDYSCKERSKRQTKDFVTNKDCYMDYLKHAIFFWWYWVCLAIVFTAGVFWITLFCLGYMIIAFFYLWMGQNILLHKRKQIILSLNIIILYNFFVIFSKCALQLVGCVYLKKLQSMGFEWLITLFGIQCINPMSWEIINTMNLKDHFLGVHIASGLHWDVICFFFLVIQRQIFSAQDFSHVVLDINVQKKFVSRGAFLINKNMMASIKEQKAKEELELSKVQHKIDKITAKQVKHGKPELGEHYLVMRSGDYDLFDGDPDEKESDIDEDKPMSNNIELNDVIDGLIWRRTSLKRTSSDRRNTIETNKDISGNFIQPIHENTISEDLVETPMNLGTVDNDENNISSQQIIINPLELLNKVIEHGPRAVVKDYIRSSSKDNITMEQRSNLHNRSRLNSVSYCDETKNYIVNEDSPNSSLLPNYFYQKKTSKNLQHSPIPSNCESLTDSPTNIISSDLSEQHDAPNNNQGNFWNKFKASMYVVYFFILGTNDQLIKFLNDLTKEYIVISKKLDTEKRLVKQSVLSKLQDDIDGKLEQVDKFSGDGSLPFETEVTKDESLPKHTFQHSKFFSLLIALSHVATIYSEFICYFLLIFNHILSSNLLSLPYPLLVFLWAMLSVPRPNKTFWKFLILYTEMVIVIKYMFQSNIIHFNVPKTSITKTNPLWYPVIIGIEKSKTYAILDVIQLLFVFLHRGYLKKNGLWRDHAGLIKDMMVSDSVNIVKSEIETSSHKIPQSSNIIFNPIFKMRNFYSKMTNPDLNKKVDVYSVMFMCEFFSLLIIIFGYVSFGPGTDSGDNALDFIKTNKIPIPFLAMIITQFFFIIIDRGLFLRKEVKGKFIFQIFYVLLIHGWLFFALPYITKRRFNYSLAPQLLYIAKCIYFGLSAYQIKSGYPLRILGNFLRKKYNYFYLILFKGYMVVPFLYELRSVMDWMWTDSPVALYHWMEVEDVFCKMFTLKCWRYAELRWPTKRGILRRLISKYTIGGLLLLFLTICFWAPLTISSFIIVIYVKNPPIECSFSVNIDGYSPIFVFSSRENNLKPISIETFQHLKSCYEFDLPSINYLQSFEANDVTEITIDGVSDDSWLITPPGHQRLKQKLSSVNHQLKINMQAICERATTDSKTVEKIVHYTHSRNLSESEKQKILQTMDISSNVSHVHLKNIFPRFLTAYKQKITEAKPLLKINNSTFLDLELSMKLEDSIMWWEINETLYGKTYCAANNESDLEKRLNMTLYMFNERISDTFFGHIFSSYGIIGIYAAYFFVVHRVMRAFYSNISYIICCEELPNVDRIIQLLNDIYLVRENKKFLLEEHLIAKLIFLFRSSDTMIKWTRHKKSIITQFTESSESQTKENEVENNAKI